MPQGDHIELHRKRYGRQLDHEERTRKREARSVKKRAAYAQKALGIKGKMFAKERYKEKALMKKTIAMHEQKDKNRKVKDADEGMARPAYLLERDQVPFEWMCLLCWGRVWWGRQKTEEVGFLLCMCCRRRADVQYERISAESWLHGEQTPPLALPLPTRWTAPRC